MNFSVEKWRYKYVELPEIHNDDDVKRYIKAAKEYFPRNKEIQERSIPIKFDNAVVQKNWEIEEIRRCIHGHNGLPGKFYFYFNYCWIKNLSGGFIRPEFRIGDVIWFHLIESCGHKKYNAEKGIICVKRRRGGFSWKMASDALYDTLFKVGAEVGMTSKGEKDADDLMKKVHQIYERLPYFLKHPISSKTKDTIVFARKSKDELGTTVLKGNSSRLMAKAPTDNQWEGTMLSKFVIDEIGKIRNAKTIWNMTEPALYQETVRMGIPILFGTAGEQTKDGVAQREFWYKNDVYNLERFFFPGWAGLFVDKYGNDNIEKAVKWILKERKKRMDLGPKEYYDFVQQYPLFAKEAFLTGGLTGLGNTKNIQEQLYKLEANPPRRVFGTFRWGVGDEPKVVFKLNNEYDQKGEACVYEYPNDQLEYTAGCDPSDHDHVQERHSELSLYILRKQRGMQPPQIVFSMTYRPMLINEYYEQAIMALVYYNDCQALIENNRNGMIKYFEYHGFLKLMKPEPKPKNQLYRTPSKRIGIRKGIQSGLELERCVNEYTDEFCDLIPEAELLEEFLVYGQENTDRAIAFGWALVSLVDDINTYEINKKIHSAVPTFRYRKINGNIVRLKK